ncbi:Fur family transcriptional regulator [Roseateles sp.]|uniref:Fur family transcriptional regulator n=1 Tax=Roseateles sp. TaxID=1971397 RepID=UPI003BA67F37
MKTSKPRASLSALARATQREALEQARRERLSALGLRVTPNRLAVLAVFEEASRALSHADIEAALPQGMDAVTLYRTLDALADAGVLSKTVGADRVSRYALMQPSAHHEEHAHFHCDGCGRVYCLPSKPPRQPSVPEGFAVAAVDLSVHGQCADCSSRDPSTPR